MSARSPDPSNKPGPVPGRRDALTASPPPAGPATNSPTGGKLPLSATERTRHRRYRHLGRADQESLYAVLDAGLRPRDIEVTSLGLEQAFLAITAEDDRAAGDDFAVANDVLANDAH